MSLLPFHHDFFAPTVWRPEKDLDDEVVVLHMDLQVLLVHTGKVSMHMEVVLRLYQVHVQDGVHVLGVVAVLEHDQGSREHSYDIENSTSHRIERSFGSVQRSIRLPPNADQNSTSASFENGVLTVSLPKVAPTPKSTRIPVNVSKK